MSKNIVIVGATGRMGLALTRAVAESGDLRIVAKGSSSLVVKESQQVRRNEFLQQTANPIDMQILGIPGRAAILREVAKGLDMDTDELIPDPEQLQMMQMMAPPPTGGVSGQAPPPGEAPTETDPAGQPMGGTDNHTLTMNPNFGGMN